MSATGRGTDRQKGDVYVTPPRLAESCVDWLVEKKLLRSDPKQRVVEPSAGVGVWCRAVKDVVECRLTAVEMEPRLKKDLHNSGADRIVIGDWLEQRPTHDVSTILGNPPYDEAEDHVRHAHKFLHVNGILAYLLRLNFLGSQARWAGFWQAYPPAYVVPILPRPSFLLEDLTPVLNKDGKQGSDATEYALFVWRKANQAVYDKKHVLSELEMRSPILWAEPGKRRKVRKQWTIK
jgi:hypothetical protein